MDSATAPASDDATGSSSDAPDRHAPAAPADKHTAPPPGSRWATAAWIGSSLLLVILVVAIWMRVSGDRAGADLANAIIRGDRPAAPALPTEPVDGAAGLPDWYESADGTQVASSDNEVLVVNWWASWCGPCREEAPVLNEIADEYDGRVTVVGLNAASKDLASDAADFADEFELEFPLVRGDRSYNDSWGVNGYPETFVVGTDGRISSFVNGPVDEATLRGLLDAELEEDRS